ncbi:U1 small nuclear ribonucleoprotein of 70kDa MW N terminal-domain-containing protein [Pavlovales sp. CCMP2436]|nr:U1 small nuclear ribonucleoprotein of 70kDa MW N terminal-domain-containing protein [Pavlovales sp. CCMP2436]
MSKEVASGLPPSILALFAARQPVVFKAPPKKSKCRAFDGVSSLVDKFEAKDEAVEEAAKWTPYVSLPERRARAKALRRSQAEEKAEEMREQYDPASDPKATGDPFRTLFVARLPRSMDEATLRAEFKTFGPIKAVRIVKV